VRAGEREVDDHRDVGHGARSSRKVWSVDLIESRRPADFPRSRIK
jgi:hypothetical protein